MKHRSHIMKSLRGLITIWTAILSASIILITGCVGDNLTDAGSLVVIDLQKELRGKALNLSDI